MLKRRTHANIFFLDFLEVLPGGYYKIQGGYYNYYLLLTIYTTYYIYYIYYIYIIYI